VVRKIAPEALNASLPSLLLQPLVENAVRHGLAPRIEGGTLTIEAALADQELRVTVADDGIGAEQLVDGVGLGNSRARLRHAYGDRQSIEIETAPGAGFRVTVRVPQ
jgi:LytS/YehU family sensor histidine kinase